MDLQKTQQKMMKRKVSSKNSVNNLRKGLFLILKAPFENHNTSEYSYYKSNDKIEKKDPLWIAKIERYYRKNSCADLVFYRSNGENNIIDQDIVLNLDTDTYKVKNICGAHVLTIYNKNNKKDDTFVHDLVEKINESNESNESNGSNIYQN